MSASDSDFLPPDPDPNPNPSRYQPFERLALFVYLLPILGAIPATVSLWKTPRDRKQQQVKRLSILLGLLWLTGTAGFTLSSQNAETLAVPFLVASTLWTSGYFLISLGLMFRLWKNLPLLPTQSK